MRSQLNQVRAWVRQGRTDAWIAHQLDVSASELRDFIRRNNLSADEEASDDIDLRDEIEAEIEATMEADEEEDEADDEEPEDDAEPDEDEEPAEDEADDSEPGEAQEEAPDAPRGRSPRGARESGGEQGGGGGRRRRRRRRGPKRAGAGLEATFDHGDADGYGLWLDPAIKTDPVYSEHWKGHRKVEVTVEPEQIVIRRSG
ncbi:MAG: hypothetical protein ACR2G3_06300 [Solirubrobacterales bacterium]